MTTDDARLPADRLEHELTALFAVGPGADALQRLDQRVGRRLASGSLGSRRPRRGVRRLGLVGLLAAALVVAGANGSLTGLYLFIWGPFDVPWHRGVDIGLTQVVDGYRVTIDRVYADSARIALALSVVDERRREGTTELATFGVHISDEAGTYQGMFATSHPEGRFAAVGVKWAEPPILPLPAGPRAIHVEVPSVMWRDDTNPPADANDTEWNPWHWHPGPWVFDFEIDVDGGTVLTPDAVAEVEGVEVRLRRVIAASHVVRIELEYGGLSPAIAWAPVGSVAHEGREARLVAGGPGEGDTVMALTDGGFANVSGEWVVTIDALSGPDASLEGPWVLRFEVP